MSVPNCVPERLTQMERSMMIMAATADHNAAEIKRLQQSMASITKSIGELQQLMNTNGAAVRQLTASVTALAQSQGVQRPAPPSRAQTESMDEIRARLRSQGSRFVVSANADASWS